MRLNVAILQDIPPSVNSRNIPSGPLKGSVKGSIRNYSTPYIGDTTIF